MNEQKDRDDTDDDRREGQISYNPGARDPPLGGTQEHRYNEECEQRDDGMCAERGITSGVKRSCR